MTDEEFAALNITMRRPPPYGVGWIGASDPAMLPSLPARLVGQPDGANYAAAFCTAAAAMPTPTVDDLLTLKARLAPLEPEQAIITPSLDALRAVLPFVEMEPTGRRTLSGIRVVVTEHATRPQLIPAAALDRPPFRNAIGEFLELERYRRAVMHTAVLGAGEPPAADQADTPTVVTAEEP